MQRRVTSLRGSAWKSVTRLDSKTRLPNLPEQRMHTTLHGGLLLNIDVLLNRLAWMSECQC